MLTFVNILQDLLTTLPNIKVTLGIDY